MKYTFQIVDVFSSTPFAVNQLDRATASTLERNGVLIQDAITGTVTALSNAEFGQTARRSVAPSGVERAILHEVDK
jgi:hypothetical protein